MDGHHAGPSEQEREAIKRLMEDVRLTHPLSTVNYICRSNEIGQPGFIIGLRSDDVHSALSVAGVSIFEEFEKHSTASSIPFGLSFGDLPNKCATVDLRFLSPDMVSPVYARSALNRLGARPRPAFISELLDKQLTKLLVLAIVILICAIIALLARR